MKTIKITFYFLTFNFLLLTSFSCTKDLYRKVAVNTKEVSAITGSSAIGAGRIIDEGKEGAAQYGHCWDIASSPTTDKNKTELGSSAGRKDYTSILSNLTPETKYYVRAYATDKHESNKVVYGAEISFTTSATIVAPTVTTTATSAIAQTTATSGGNVTSDGGATVTARGVCWSTSTNPTVSNSLTNNGTGTGTFTSSITGLTASTLYYVRAYATNSAGTSYGNQISFTTSSSFICGTSTVTDYDGNVYNTVLIGTQCWMKENLNYGTYAAVTSPQVAGTKFCQNLSGVNDATCPMGGLYEWANIMNGSASCNGTGAPPNDKCPTNVQGLCPAGWHIPSHYEWTTLEKNVGTNPGAFPYDVTTTGWLGTDEGGNLKQTGTTNWISPNTGATNSSGFTALPGGNSWAGSFNNAGNNGYWWSSTGASGTTAWYRKLTYNNAQVLRYNLGKAYGFSCRCVKD